MSKYQEALDNLLKYEREHNIRTFGDVVPHTNSDLLQELVDKETPMKVLILKKQYEVETEMYRNYGECPKCNHSNLIGQCRCDECGQKLDWSD